MPPKSKSVTTRSKASKQQRKAISAASGSSPPKGMMSKKQASFESPAATETTPQVVTETKQAKLSNSSNNNSSDDNSTGNENASITMVSNLTAGADPSLDKKLDHVIEEFLLAKGGNHKIRQRFKEENIYQFEDYIDYTVEDLELLRRKSHNIMKGFSKQKGTQIYNVIRYYKFLCDADITLAEDPENWAMADFRKWIDEGRHPTVASFKAAKTNATLGVTTTLPTTTTTATVCPETRKAENAWLSWQRSRRDVDKYPKISNDREYSDWITKTER